MSVHVTGARRRREITAALTLVRPVSTAGLTWRDAALCAQVDPERWFPEKGGSTRAAKQICSRCPVSAECLEFALEDEDAFRHGVWGATTERERRLLRRDRLAAAVPADGPRLCGQGLHPMTPENVYTGPDGTEEWCRACRRANKLKAVA